MGSIVLALDLLCIVYIYSLSNVELIDGSLVYTVYCSSTIEMVECKTVYLNALKYKNSAELNYKAVLCSTER